MKPTSSSRSAPSSPSPSSSSLLFFPAAYGSIHAMNIYLRRGVEFRDNDLMITGEALLKYTVQKHHLIVHDSDIRVIRVRQDGTCYHQ